MRDLLLHRNFWVRFAALWAVAAAAFVVAWWGAYALLPEGLLRGRFGAQAAAGGAQAAGSFVAEWARIAVLNLVVAGVFPGECGMGGSPDPAAGQPRR